MQGPGVWRHDWFSDRDDPKANRYQRHGLIMSEALVRASVTDEPGEHEALVELLEQIERGASDGVRLGPRETEEEKANG